LGKDGSLDSRTPKGRTASEGGPYNEQPTVSSNFEARIDRSLGGLWTHAPLVFDVDLWHTCDMGSKDARRREIRKPKKKPAVVVQAPPPIVRVPPPKS
jgi:hypothetical protein